MSDLQPRPLDGIRVIDFGRLLAAPFAGMVLADLGADVIKVEEPPTGDLTRWMMRPLTPNGEDAAYFASINRGKRSIVMDLKKPESRDVVLALAANADVILDNYRPDVRPRLGLDDASLKAANPDLVICSISAFGQSGPRVNDTGVDLNIQALSGAMHLTGDGTQPMRLGVPVADLAGGLYAVIGILAQLIGRQGPTRHRAGIIDVSLLDSLSSLLTYMAANYSVTGSDPTPVGSAHHSVVPYQAFETSDGWIVVPCLSENFWPPLCRAMNRDEWIADERFATNVDRLANRDELIELMSSDIRSATSEQWLSAFSAEGFPAAPIAKVSDVMVDAQLKHRGMIQQLDVPGSAASIEVMGSPLRPMETDSASFPRFGEHSVSVLTEVLGMSQADIARLVDSGVVIVKEYDE